MDQTHLFLLILVLLTTTSACPINPQSMPSALSCVQNIVCTQVGNGSAALVQHCNKNWYYGTSQSMSQLTQSFVPHAAYAVIASSFISNDLTSISVKAIQNYSLINFDNNSLYYYLLGSASYYNRVDSPCSMVDYEPLILPNGSIRAVMLCSNSIGLITFDSSFNMISNTSSHLNYLGTSLKCIPSSLQCLIGTNSGKLLLFNIISNSLANIYPTNVNSPVSLIKTFTISSNQHKIYVVFSDGVLNEYLLKVNYIQLDRSSEFFKGESIHDVGTYSGSSYLIVTDKRGNVTQIDLDNGTLVDSVNVNPYLANKTNPAMSLLFNNASSFYIFNTLNSAIFFISTTSPTSQNKIVLSCFDLYFYNNTLQQCSPCSSSCATCSQLNGSCFDCIAEYFNDQGQCLSCFYDSRGLTDKFSQCFSSNEKQFMETSEAMVGFMSTMVSNFAVFLNLFGVLFLFLKLINNWNIICLYFFVQMELPFFLENVMKMLFTNISSSVLATVGLQIQPTLSISNQATNNKFLLTNQTTDFIAMNTQNFILFFYSVILITTVYKIVNYLLAKVNISVFEQNTAISIIEQFVGCFTITLLPFIHVIFKTGYRDRLERVNALLHFLFVGLALIIPFCFLLFDYEYKIIRSNKVHNNDENLIAESVNLGLTKRIQAWRQDDSKQRFFYGLLSFSTALLVCSPEPKIFIFGVGFLHVLCLINSLLCRQIKINNIIQKVCFLAYHSLFSSLYFLDTGRTKLRISMVLVILIILIAVHQIFVSIYRKVYFVYMLVKGKWEKEQKIKTFFEKNQLKTKNNNRIHPIPLPPAQALQSLETKHEVKIAFKNYEVRFLKENIKEELQNKKFKEQQKRRRAVKSAKKIENIKETSKSIVKGSQCGILSPPAERRRANAD